MKAHVKAKTAPVSLQQWAIVTPENKIMPNTVSDSTQEAWSAADYATNGATEEIELKKLGYRCMRVMVAAR